MLSRLPLCAWFCMLFAIIKIYMLKDLFFLVLQVSDLRMNLNTINDATREVLFNGSSLTNMYTIIGLHCYIISRAFIGQRICKIASNNADYSYVGQCFESGNSTRYLFELLFYLNVIYFEMGI